MEKWKPIPGYEGYYDASNLGRIRTVDGKPTNRDGFIWHWKGRILKPKYQKRHGVGKLDARVCLSIDGHVKTYTVARLIALTWCPGYEEGFTVNHIDGDTLNNIPSNLEWVSNADNIRHGFETGQYSTSIPCILLSEKGKRLEFRSRCEATRFLGRGDSYIIKCIKHNRPIISASGERYGLV